MTNVDKDSLIPKKIWAPRSLSPEGERTLLGLISLSTEKGMLSHEDGERAIKLLKVNPTAQLCLLGTRIAALTNLVEEISRYDFRISTMLEGIEQSHSLLSTLILEEKKDV